MTEVFKFRECRATITARIPDTPDADQHPDRVLVQGRGTAHPQFQGGSVVFTEIGEYAIPQPVPVVIVDGELLVEVLSGDESVETQPLFLPVTVDERANQNWSWRLTFDFLTLGEYGEEVSHPPLSFPVEAGDGPLEISTVATSTIRQAGFITRGVPGRGITSITASGGVVTVEWEGGEDVEIPIPTAALATPTSDGLMSRRDKATLDDYADQGVVLGAEQVTDVPAGVVPVLTTDPDPVTGRVRPLLEMLTTGHWAPSTVKTLLADLLDTEMVDDPVYRTVVRTPGGQIIYAEKWSGEVIIPGLVDGRPPAAPTMRATLTGPSHARRMADGGFGDLLPVPMWDAAVGGWGATHSAAVVGAMPVPVTVDGGVLPASGPVAAQVHLDGFWAQAGTAVGGTIPDDSGHRVPVQLRVTGGAFEVERLTPAGAGTSVSGQVEFVSSRGQFERDGLLILCAAGANNMGTDGQYARAVRAVDAMWGYWSGPKIMVGLLPRHDYLPDNPDRQRMDAFNAYARQLADSTGAPFFDFAGFLAGPDVWAIAGLVPTIEDEEAMSLGVLPPSLDADGTHLTTVGYQAAGRAICDLAVSAGLIYPA